MVYPDPSSRSAQLYARASQVMAGGSTRLTTWQAPYPIYAASGSGCRIRDVDGVERIDFLNNYMTLIHGHAHPEIVAAVQEQAARGLSFAMPTENEVMLAELLCGRVKSFEQIRFCNSGSEAVMVAVKAARAHNGRPMIAKCEGAYHGMFDPVEVSHDANPGNWGDVDAPARTPYTRGLPENVMRDVVVIPHNDVARSRHLLELNADRLAAVIIDPLPPRIGFVPATAEFLRMVREVCDRHDIVMISDEVASFRIDYNGPQHVHGFDADLTTMGKIIGGGMPVGAVAGKKAFMDVFNPTRGRPLASHGGTFNSNPMTMAAGYAAMRMMTPEAFARLATLGDRLAEGLRAAFRDANMEGQVTGAGSLWKIHMNNRRYTDYRSVHALPAERKRLDGLYRHLLNAGFVMGPTGLIALSTAMGEKEVDDFCGAVHEGLMGIRRASGEAA
ncbi:MAG: aspartate aminotransferase family protein [Alphaproteobacteria bacterium]|nr:aspartate aminotransferase family protein [Alphaproteobacteria bacterium]